MDEKILQILNYFQNKFHFERNKSIRELSNKLISDTNRFSINYYFDTLAIHPETVLILSLMFSSLFFILTSLLIFILNNILFILLSFFIGYLVFQRTLSIFNREINSEKYAILSYNDLIFQEFLMIMNTNKSIFDAIRFIANGNYPIISREFKKLIFKINNGETPEETLLEYMEKQPCEAFKNKMFNLINSNFNSNYIIQELAKDSSEIYLEYEKINKELDGKLILIIGFSIFIPMLISITLSFYSLSSNYLILLLFPIYYLISIFIEKKTFSYELLLLGDFTRGKSDEEKKFDDLIAFFSLFSNYLKERKSPERAFIIAYNKFNGVLKEKLGTMINQMVLSNMSLENFLNKLLILFQDNQSKRIIEIITRMILFDSFKASNQIQFIISRIKVNQEFINKRKMIFESQKFKINILCVILNGILGLISAISPLISFSSFQIFNESINFSINQMQILSFIPIFLLLGLISFYSTLYVLKIFKIHQKEIKTSLYFLIFVFIFILSLQIMI